MIAGLKINELVNAYCSLRDRQYAAYARCAGLHGLTVNELFVLDILWFSPEGCTQKQICERLSANKQTVNAVVARFYRRGYLAFEEVGADRRNKKIILTDGGKDYAGKIIPPAADAENLAMADMSLTRAAEFVKLASEFTENMERRFARIEEEIL